MNRDKGRTRYLEVGVIVIVIAVLALLMRSKVERTPEGPDSLKAVREDLKAVVGPVWGLKNPDIGLECSPNSVLDVHLLVTPGVHPRTYWLCQVVDFICANQPDSCLRRGNVIAIDMAWSSNKPRSSQDEGYGELHENRRVNKFLEQMLGPHKALFLMERDGEWKPVSESRPPRGELALRTRKKAAETDAGEPALYSEQRDLNLHLDPDFNTTQQPSTPDVGQARCYDPANEVRLKHFRGFIILSATVDANLEDGMVRARLAPIFGAPEVPASIKIIHLKPHVPSLEK